MSSRRKSTPEPIAVQVIPSSVNTGVVEPKRTKGGVSKRVAAVPPKVEIQDSLLDTMNPLEMTSVVLPPLVDDMNTMTVIEETELPLLTEQMETEPVKRNRRAVTKDSLVEDFESYITLFTEFWDGLKADKVKLPKTNLIKKLKQLQTDSYKLAKIKIKKDDKKSRSESTSGFMKPIQISNELAGFLGFKPGTLVTRVDVTKKLCNYIKTNDLQNPEDRRVILPDKKLIQLFHIKDSSDELTYYSMQKKLQSHIIKIVSTEEKK